MIYMADTADLDALKDLYRYLPLEGVTTNPSILAKGQRPLSKVIPAMLDIIGKGMLHLQMLSDGAEDILAEALAYKKRFALGANYYVKIPVTREGLRAIRLVKQSGMNVTATAIFTQQQALIAAKAGADYVAPYVNRLDNISGDGVGVVADIVKAYDRYQLPTRVLAASFKNVDQIYRASLAGCHSVTATPDILELLTDHPMTDLAVETFRADGAEWYDVERKP
jgi:fructose-6-phosphate aldolase 2